MEEERLTIGQSVEILVGEDKGTVGQIISHDWDDENDAWEYFVGKADRKYGPYTREQLG